MDLFWIKSQVPLLNVSKERRADQVHTYGDDNGGDLCDRSFP